jgi:dipeptidyl aminopeptidase/acylaminoacyl peptidase
MNRKRFFGRLAALAVTPWTLTWNVARAQQSVAAAPLPPQIPVELLFRKPAHSRVVASPDQRFLAAITSVHGRQNLAVVDVGHRTSTLLTNFSTVDVRSVSWVTNDRLVFSTGDQQGLEFRSDGGLFAIDRDGANSRVLVEPYLGASNSGKLVFRSTSVIGRIKGNQEEIFVSSNDRSLDTQDIYRMNILSGHKTLASFESPGKVQHWVMDTQDVPRAAFSEDAAKKRWWSSYLDPETKQWKILAEWDEQLSNVIIPYAFSQSRQPEFIVVSNVGRDTLAFFKFDLRSGKLGELIYGDDRYDMGSFNLVGEALGEGGDLIFGGTEENPGEILGVNYQADKPKVVWFDEAAAKAQATVDAALPGRSNVFDVNKRTTLVLSRSDTHPGSYYIFDQDKRTLEDTGIDLRPGIDPRRMAAMQPVSWTARDGVRIDGYLTLPLNYRHGAPVPLVLHPHGGPWAKDNWGFNSEVQFLANRGYAVLQPNFRGSTGFGAQFLRLSYKQWGGTMIDDMIDGVEWAVSQGFANRNRIAVYGASYGGYATLMALEKRPDLFKWGVNYVGVTDLAVHQDTQPAQRRGNFYELAKAIDGDQYADKAIFEAQSPARHVSSIAAPVFHAYAGEDLNVDIANGRTIKAAFESSNKPFEWMFVQDEAHGYRQSKNVFEFYNRFDQFIKKNMPTS